MVSSVALLYSPLRPISRQFMCSDSSSEYPLRLPCFIAKEQNTWTPRKGTTWCSAMPSIWHESSHNSMLRLSFLSIDKGGLRNHSFNLPPRAIRLLPEPPEGAPSLLRLPVHASRFRQKDGAGVLRLRLSPEAGQ